MLLTDASSGPPSQLCDTNINIPNFPLPLPLPLSSTLHFGRLGPSSINTPNSSPTQVYISTISEAGLVRSPSGGMSCVCQLGHFASQDVQYEFITW